MLILLLSFFNFSCSALSDIIHNKSKEDIKHLAWQPMSASGGGNLIFEVTNDCHESAALIDSKLYKNIYYKKIIQKNHYSVGFYDVYSCYLLLYLIFVL